MKIRKFEELNIWKSALKITKEIYDLTSKNEFEKINQEMEDLTNQIGSFIVYLENKRRNKEFITR